MQGGFDAHGATHSHRIVCNFEKRVGAEIAIVLNKLYVRR